MEKIVLEQLKSRKIALVLSGGVVKAGAWHLGVALALSELGISVGENNAPHNSGPIINTYVGSSAGAFISCLLANGLTPDEIIRSNLGIHSPRMKRLNYKDMLRPAKPFKTKQYKSEESNFFQKIFPSFISPLFNSSGLFSTQGVEKYLKNNICQDKTFDDVASDLFIVATQLDHSRKVIFSKYHYPNPRVDNTASYYTGFKMAETVAASMSVPPLYSPYPIKNPQTKRLDYYIDGEIRETLSTHVARDNNCDIIISSWTHTPYHYHDEIGSLVQYGLPSICVQAIYLMIQKKIISSRAYLSSCEDIIQTVDRYLAQEKFSSRHRKNIKQILEKKLDYNEKIKFIDIYPQHDNHRLFFSSFFSLNKKSLAAIIKMGHKETMRVFQTKYKDLEI